MTRVVTRSFLKNTFRVIVGWASPTTSSCDWRPMVGSAHPTSVFGVTSNRGKHQRGFALVAAIFIVVVLALLGIMMVTIGGMQRATATTTTQGTRAYYAARTGIEWGTYQAVVAGSCVLSSTFPLSAPGLNGFSVTVQCTSTPHQEHGPPPYNVYVLTSTATSGAFGDADYVSRTLKATVTDAPPP